MFGELFVIEKILDSLFWLTITGGLFLILIFQFSKWLQPPKSTSKLSRQLYAGGEQIKAKDRRYFESTLQYVSYFSILDMIGFFLGTLFIRTTINASLITSASMSFLIILMLTVLILVRSNDEWKRGLSE